MYDFIYFFSLKVESVFIPPIGLAPEPSNPNTDGVEALTMDRGNDDTEKRRAKRPENTYLVRVSGVRSFPYFDFTPPVFMIFFRCLLMVAEAVTPSIPTIIFSYL